MFWNLRAFFPAFGNIVTFLILGVVCFLSGYEAVAQNKPAWYPPADTLYLTTYRLKERNKEEKQIKIAVYVDDKKRPSMVRFGGYQKYMRIIYMTYYRLSDFHGPLSFYYSDYDSSRSILMYSAAGSTGQWIPFIDYPRRGWFLTKDSVVTDVIDLNYLPSDKKIHNYIYTLFVYRLCRRMVKLDAVRGGLCRKTDSVGVYEYEYRFCKFSRHRYYHSKHGCCECPKRVFWRVVLRYSPSKWITYVASYKRGKLKYELRLDSLKKYH